ncbi:MAG: hypothetical protein IBJ18_13060 [Phycisphaerales bacterium]|nr:hypothetical protein [Phycisphaerales bacterium]
MVDPRFRGIGLSSELVRCYLREPLTTHTESLAAMGCACPFLLAGGMQQLELPRSTRDERLLHDLRALGARPADLLGGARVIDHRSRHGRALRRALLRWAKASKATARGAEKRTTADLLSDAAGALRPTRLVYVHSVSIGSVQPHGEGNR